MASLSFTLSNALSLSLTFLSLSLSLLPSPLSLPSHLSLSLPWAAHLSHSPPSYILLPFLICSVVLLLFLCQPYFLPAVVSGSISGSFVSECPVFCAVVLCWAERAPMERCPLTSSRREWLKWPRHSISVGTRGKEKCRKQARVTLTHVTGSRVWSDHLLSQTSNIF